MKIIFLFACCIFSLSTFSQSTKIDSTLNALRTKHDSTLRAAIHNDSLRLEKEYAEKIREEKMSASLTYPVLNAGIMSGVVPVADIMEAPDLKKPYKLLFELVYNNPDSASKDINFGLSGMVRIINLHAASGIPLKNISTVIVVHADALNAFTNNEYYKEKYKIDNPNIKLINDLQKLGCKMVACGQALAFFNIKREALLPGINVALTAQTMLSSYQMAGYVKY
ncbi:MAG: DsrE family protein [Ferruginibacter sp.]